MIHLQNFKHRFYWLCFLVSASHPGNSSASDLYFHHLDHKQRKSAAERFSSITAICLATVVAGSWIFQTLQYFYPGRPDVVNFNLQDGWDLLSRITRWSPRKALAVRRMAKKDRSWKNDNSIRMAFPMTTVTCVLFPYSLDFERSWPLQPLAYLMKICQLWSLPSSS